jgi:hypothetical protein
MDQNVGVTNLMRFPCWDLIYKRPETLFPRDLPEYFGLSEVGLDEIMRRFTPAGRFDLMCRLNGLQTERDLSDIYRNCPGATEHEVRMRLTVKRYGPDFARYHFGWRDKTFVGPLIERLEGPVWKTC